jgi:hypothetical protein
VVLATGRQRRDDSFAAKPDECDKGSRAVVLKHGKVEIGPRIDEIDRQLSLAMSHVQANADLAVCYALAYSNNSLAITYFKQVRNIPVEEAQKGQLDSMVCAMESRLALMKGVLPPGGSCSVCSG